MSKLDDLVYTLTEQIKNKDKKISSIKYPVKLLKALVKLKNLIGMNDVKNNIADQVIFLIMASQQGEKKKYMLNTVFYGPPGVGKTKVGIILAEIWHGLGYIEDKTTVYGKMSNCNYEPITILIIALFFIYGLQILAYAYHQVGIFYLSLIIGFILLIGLIVYYIYINECGCDIVKKEDGEIIKIVSRKDFVAEYVGQTAIKTQRLLNAYKGKVLFIDEAYSLMNDSRDPFGLEALTTLNQFMSENPEELVVIFAGYKDKMQNGIFSEQPGLPRRCMWHFECNGYNGTELFEIFESQLGNEGWKFYNSDRNRIRRLIEENYHIFPAYGGDTERLCFFSKLESTNESFHQGVEISKKLKAKQVEKGINLLSKNNICNNKNNSDDNYNYDDLLKLLSKNKNKNPPLNGD